jgi:hypothetical protein
VLPDEYSFLAEATGYRPLHFRWKCGELNLVILGNADPNQVKQKGQWTDSLPQDHILTRWARRVHHERMDTSRKVVWDLAFTESRRYHTKHRELVRKIGKVLQVDMDSHNLTKSTLVHYALGYMWFWPQEHDPATRDLAEMVMKEHHRKREDHYCEYPGIMDSKKVVADRLGAHILVDKGNDGQRGWRISSWLYPDVVTDYEHIKKEFGHTNLYHLKNLPKLPLPQLWYSEKK